MAKRNTSLASKTTVRIAAISIFVIGGAVVALIAISSGAGSGGNAKPSGVGRGPIGPPVVNVAEAGPKSGGKARGQLFDPKNPQRIVGSFEWSAFDALGPGRARVTGPRAVIAIGDTLVAVVSSATGELALSSRDQPESGTLTGGVPVLFYSRVPGGSIEPEGLEPIAQFFTPEVTFNLPLGELSIPGDFRISMPAAEMRGRGLRMLGNQVDSRIELIELEHADYAWFDPTVRAKTEGETGTRGDRKSKPKSLGVTPVEVCYSAIFGENVRLKREQATVTADGLELLLRLVDGELPANAIGEAAANKGPKAEVGAIAKEKPGDAATVAVAAEPPLAPVGGAPISGEPASLARPTGAALSLAWDGMLTMTPVAERPELLEENDVAARLFSIRPPSVDGPANMARASSRRDGVQIDDASIGGHAEAMQVVYGATRGDLSLRGGEGRALIGQPGKGHVEAATISINLFNGLGAATGPGMLVGEGARSAVPGTGTDPATGTNLARAVSFAKSAEFRLATRNGTISDVIEEVVLDGDVQGHDGVSFIEADRLTATFMQAEGLKNALARVVATGVEGTRALAGSDRDGRRESMGADRLDVQFEKVVGGPEGRSRARTVPQVVTAKGNAETRRGTLVMNCGLLEANLIDVVKKFDPAKPDVVEKERVVGPVRIEGGLILTDTNLRVVADGARADAVAQSADLTGKAIRIERDGGVVTGTQMRLLAQDRSLRVFGPGGFEYRADATADAAAAGAPMAVESRWTSGMFVSDVRGRMECVGDVAASFSPSQDETNTLRAAAVNLEFTPAPADGNGGGKPSGADKGTSAGQRSLVRAEAIGEATDSPVPANATIESRRFTAESRGRADRDVERVFYIEGPKIVGERLDTPAALLTVAGKGRLLIDDRRASDNEKDAAQAVTSGTAPLQLSGSTGTSLFSWNNQLTFDRGSGDIAIELGARLLHRPKLTDPVTTLDCERIEAKVRTQGGTSAANSIPTPTGTPTGTGQIELVSVKALGGSGQAIVQSEGKRIEADDLVFDALSQIAEAISRGDRRVSFIDPTKPTPLVAERLYWDLKNNKVTVERPSPIVAPR